MRRITGLAKLIKLARDICIVIALFGPRIRQFVPASRQADYDQALAAILAACDVLTSIGYEDNAPGTNPPWGI